MKHTKAASVSPQVILLLVALISVSLLSVGFCAEEPIVTGPLADPLFHDQGTFSTPQIAIAKILQYPQDYDLHFVTLKGTVRKIDRPRVSDSLDLSTASEYGALGCFGRYKPLYSFYLEDDTGSLKVGVFYSLSCYPLQIAVMEGDKIIAEVKIVVSDKDEVGRDRRTIVAKFGRGKRITE